MQRIGGMGKRAKSGGGLRIHRETLRSLSAESLGRVAGGDGGDDCDVQDPHPRTNAWTGRESGLVDPAFVDPALVGVQELCR